jgi:3-hydroxyacyl-CoA dehydrogenase
VTIKAKGVADRSDIDTAWCAATGQTIGPFGILASVGVDSFIAVIDELRVERLIAAGTADTVRSHLRSTS